MTERRSTLAEVAERMRVSPRWLRDRVNRMPVKVGDRFGRLWTFTASQERALIDLLQEEHKPVVRLGQRPPAKRWQPTDDAYVLALRLASKKPLQKEPPGRGKRKKKAT